MIVTFRSKAAGEVIMLGEHARPLLELAGKMPEIAAGTRGVFTPEQLPEAIRRIETAIGIEKEPRFDEDNPEEKEKAASHVGLKQRAFPLLDMLRKAQAQNVNVTWEN
ncbi:DUF1840 domain-containing protein [Pigmentiphaga sp.]|uniref:DUF1840 domain-containing protein n=1 Tax=Pigmentiphaga sp. TaxID=1977564 RepID=UPI00128B9863|nr:DUF1840 domain-containing protein [Pigmentiphaga sp.]MPS25555.1 DUF1840 domain-containing protein [Alcaligenaceae bacterium SAGV5]MPS54194.1 DUF1840 domain-containing protein [Alcaligenaceae bacterium SAGV3]MPT56169.1 DUF1840 domain-containing protein [Alcaligenaceae bacterium]